MLDQTTLFLFSPYEREVASPTRQPIKGFEQFQNFVDTHDGLTDCYADLYTQPFTGVIDKIYFDFDGVSNGMEEALPYAQAFYRFLVGIKKLNVIPVASGKKGFNLYVILKEQSYPNAKQLLHDVAYSLIVECFGKVSQFTHIDKEGREHPTLVKVDENGKPTEIICIDPKIIGDVRRFSRIPNTLRPPENNAYCVPLETVMLGSNCTIGEITVNNDSIGSDLEYNRVLATSSRVYIGNMIQIKASNLLPITVTPDHYIMVISKSQKSRSGNIINSYRSKKFIDYTIKFKKAIDIDQNDYLLIPIHEGIDTFQHLSLSKYISNKKTYLIGSQKIEVNKICKLCGKHLKSVNNWHLKVHNLTITEYEQKFHIKPTTWNSGIRVLLYPDLTELVLNEDLAWLIGLYIADGFRIHYNSTNSTVGFGIALNETETDIHKKVKQILINLGLPFSIQKHCYSEVLIHCKISYIAQAFEDWCGSDTYSKKIPNFILFNTNKKIIRQFLDGYIAGDGCIATKQAKRKGTVKKENIFTVSKIIAIQLQFLYTKLSLLPGISQTKAQVSTLKNGGVIISKGGYNVGCTISSSLKNFSYVFIGSNYIATPVRNIKIVPYQGLVANIQTQDQTYLVNNAIVHNCTYLDPYLFPKMSITDVHKAIKHKNTFAYQLKSYTTLKDIEIHPRLSSLLVHINGNGQKQNSSTFNHNLDTSHLEQVLRPCLFKNMLSPEPRHDVRVASTADLIGSGFSTNEILEMYRKLKWIDFNEETTRYQIEHCKPIHYNKNTLKEKGICFNCGRNCR